MTRLFLLDTNIVSDLVRRPSGVVAEMIANVGETQVCTSVIVAEIRYGAVKKGSPRLTKQLEAVLGAMNVLSLETPADRFYGTLRSGLERAGELIDPNDLLIAAHALAVGCVLVSDNEREFARVPELRIEIWLKGGRGGSGKVYR